MSIGPFNFTLEDDENYDTFETTESLLATLAAATRLPETGGGVTGEKDWTAMRQYYSKVLLGLARDPHTAAGLMGLNSTGLETFLSPHNSALANLSNHLTSLVKRRQDPGRAVIIILVYSMLIVVSLFGNLLVCHVVLRTRRLHTLTNTFLANLAVSDLLMTVLNIPFNVARVLLDDWPFGSFMCSIVPFVQVTSVYVSAFTMVAIALDRYQVIVHPLKPRLGSFHGALIITGVWLLAAFVSLPYAIYSEVGEVFTYRKLTRCQARYPSPALQFRQWLTLATFLTQYVVPLSITAMAYVCVTRRVWWRAVVGAATQEQLSLQLKTKKKTVKMLLIVVVLFALCWLPLNTYHLVVDFGASVGPSRHSSSIFFICHWFAMSNVCYNPFIYCWLNDHFRAGAKAWLRCVGRKICCIPLPKDNEKHPGTTVSRPRDSVTLSSSALVGGSSVKRKILGGSFRDNQASDFHVTLDELMTVPTSSRSHLQRSNNRFKNFNRFDATSILNEDEKAVQTEETYAPQVTPQIVSVVTCSHGACTRGVELPCIEVNPSCILNHQNLHFRTTIGGRLQSSQILADTDNCQSELTKNVPVNSTKQKAIKKSPLKSDAEILEFNKLSETDSIISSEFEKISQNPKLQPILEELPMPVPQQTILKCLECQQILEEKIITHGDTQLPNIESVLSFDEAVHVKNYVHSNQAKTEVEIHIVPDDTQNTGQNKIEICTNDTIKTFSANLVESLRKNNSSLGPHDKSSLKIYNSFHEEPETQQSCRHCEEELPILTKTQYGRHSPICENSGNVTRAGTIDRSSSLQKCIPRHKKYDYVVRPNVVLECSSVSGCPLKSFNSQILISTNAISGDPKDDLQDNEKQISIPIPETNTPMSTRIPLIQQDSNEYLIANETSECLLRPKHKSHTDQVLNSLEDTPNDIALSHSNILQNSSIIKQSEHLHSSSFQFKWRTTSTPNLNFQRPVTLIPQHSSQSTKSLKS